MKQRSGTSHRSFPRLGSLLRRPAFPVALMIILALTASASLQILSEGLIFPARLTYLGAFRLPDGPPEIGWEWSGEALTYYPGGDAAGPRDGFPGSLFGTGHNWNTYVSEISIPVPVISQTKNVKALAVAKTLQKFHDIRGGLFGYLEIPRVGLEYLPPQGRQTAGKLYFAWAQHMGEGETIPTHGWADLNLAAPHPAGAWRIRNYWNYVTGDYLFAIPREWAALFYAGRTLATGRYRDGGQGAQGPSLFAISPWTSGNPPAPGTTLPATPLLLYGNAYSAGSPRMTGYARSDEWTGGAWLTVPGASAVIFAGTKGLGNTWYGCPDGTVWPDEPPFPPDCPDRGWWSDRFEGQILFYNPAALVNVALGKIKTWGPQPYAVAKVDKYLFNIRSSQQKSHLGAMAYDRARGFIYIMEPLADGDKPLIHVWKIKTPA
jgi:hypothetical protein